MKCVCLSMMNSWVITSQFFWFPYFKFPLQWGPNILALSFLIKQSLYVYVMYMCVCMFKCVWGHVCVQVHLHMSVNMRGGPKFMLDNFLSCSPSHLWRQALPTEPKLTNSATSSQLALEIYCLSLPSAGIKHSYRICQALIWILRIWTPHLCGENFIHWTIFQPSTLTSKRYC